MLIEGTVVDVKKLDSGKYSVKIFPKDIGELPKGAMNMTGSFFIANGAYHDKIQKGMTVSVDGKFTTNTYKPTNFFQKRHVPDLIFFFNNFKVISGMNNDDGLKNFVIKEIKFIGEKLVENIFSDYTSEEFVKLFKENDKINVLKKLSDIKGIGKKKAEIIYESWMGLEDKRDIFTELFKFGLSSNKAGKIYNHFGKDSVEKIKENPYIITYVKGIGFKEAEEVAEKYFKIDKQSQSRYNALIYYFIGEICSNDTIFSVQDLNKKIANFILNDQYEYTHTVEEITNKGIEGNIKLGNIVKINDDIYMLSSYFELEKFLYDKVIERKGKKNDISIDYSKVSGYDYLNKDQKEALEICLNNKISILIGGAGTGKTTTTKVLFDAIEKLGKTYVCICPTNKAVKRVKEVNKKVLSNGNIITTDAKTIHSLLGIKKGSSQTKYNENNKLPYDYVFIDEAGMPGEYNISLIFKALKNDSSIGFIGDPNQIGSIEAGSYLNDLFQSKIISESTKMLSVIERTDKNTEVGFGEIDSKLNNITANTYRILDGKLPISTASNTFAKYYDYNNQEMYDDILLNIKNLYRKMRDNKIDYFQDFQVLIPNYKGDLGIHNINRELSKFLNGKSKSFEINEKEFRVGDKIYYNDVHKEYELVKGDTGIIKDINESSQKVKIYFYDIEKEVEFNYTDLVVVELGYAMSVHKSQGSEFDYVATIITSSSYILLNNNILYTAYSRGKKKSFLFGDKAALLIALNNKENARNTLLFNLLSGIKFEDVELVKDRTNNSVTEEQVRFVKKYLSDIYKKDLNEFNIITIKSNFSELSGFNYLWGSKEYLKKNELYDGMEMSMEIYEKFRFDKNLMFLRISNVNEENKGLNGFYKSKVYNHFNHNVVQIFDTNKIKYFTKNNIIKNVF